MTFASGKVSLKLCWLKAFISMHTYTYWVCYFIANARCVWVFLHTIANQVAVHKLNWLHCKSLYDVAHKSQKTTAIFSIFHVFPCFGSSFFPTWLYKCVFVCVCQYENSKSFLLLFLLSLHFVRHHHRQKLSMHLILAEYKFNDKSHGIKSTTTYKQTIGESLKETFYMKLSTTITSLSME